MESVKELPTTGEIARMLGVSRDAIQYAIRSRRITPAGRAGCAFIYDDEAIAEIRKACSAKDHVDDINRHRGAGL